MNHQAATKIFYRRLEKAWLFTELNKADPDPIIKELFRLTVIAARKRTRLKPVMTFTHNIQDKNVNMNQKYRVTSLGRVVLIPPNSFYCHELPGAAFKI